MKRLDLLKHLREQGCQLLREGGQHTYFIGPDGRKKSAIPRHTEIRTFVGRKIWADLGISPPPFK